MPGLAPGRYEVTAWDTAAGERCADFHAFAQDGALAIVVPSFVADLGLAIRPSQQKT